MSTHNLASSPIGLTAVFILSINIAVLTATLPNPAAASVSTSTEAAHRVGSERVALAHAVDVTDRTHMSFGDYPADTWAEGAAIKAASSPATGYRADGTFERGAISAAGLTASRHLDAAAESAAQGQARRAAERSAVDRGAAEKHTATHITEPAPTATPSAADGHQDRAERAADAMPFDWSAHGITFKIGCHPEQSRCAWGTFDYHVDEVWLSSAAFATDARLRYVVAHEMAHAWQWSTNLDDREADLTDFGVSTSNGIEYGADCVAEAWGYPVATYWDCPSDAVAHMRSVFAATA